MKALHAAIITIVLAIAAPARAAQPPGADTAATPPEGASAVDEAFPPALRELIDAYKGTLPGRLPKLERRAMIERRNSTVPGRMLMKRHITVNKDARRLYLMTAVGDTMLRFPVCASANRGQKEKADDNRTPEGTFPLYGIYNSTDWTYKDTDSKCYGPIFLSIKTPRYWGVGIHGTNAPSSVPGRSSHGCMRLHNENVLRLKPLVQKDLWVTVLPDP